MELSEHARSRIVSGDELGFRTLLFVKEVLDILHSDRKVKTPEGYIFYSKKDQGCIEAIVDEHLVVTILRGDDAHVSLRLQATGKALSARVVSGDELPAPKKWGARSGATISIQYGNTESIFYNLAQAHGLLSWPDYRVSLWTYEQFLSIIADAIEANFDQALLRRTFTASLLLEGEDWYYVLPLSLPFELLGREPPSWGRT